MSTLIEKMLDTIHRFKMAEPGETVLVAVSGGPDSLVLLHALSSVKEHLKVNLHTAHLNHGIRGKESDEDALFVEEFSLKLGIPCKVEKVDTPQIRKVLGFSEEETARILRYDFLERTAEEVGATRIALGHTADDQVETVLLNLIRGVGLDGLSGMPAIREKIIRPLIEIRRSEIESYAQEQGLQPRIDYTNLLPLYTRNKVRLELLPLLRTEFNPKIDTIILRLAELARADTTYLNSEAEKILSKLIIEEKEGKLSLYIAGIMNYPIAIRRRIVRKALALIRKDMTNIEFIHVNNLLELLEKGKDFEFDLPGGIYVARTRDVLSIFPVRPSEELISYNYELIIPGETTIPEIEAVVRARISSTPVDYVRPPKSLEIVADFGTIKGKLRVRNWIPGDRIHPLGMTGTKKVQDIFTDAKIPRKVRYRIPIIADDEKILWVVGLAMLEEIKVSTKTREYLILSFNHTTEGCPYFQCVV